MAVIPDRPDFRAFFECHPDGALWIQPDHWILDANPAACRLLERDRADLVTRRWTDLIDPNDLRIGPFLQSSGPAPAAGGLLRFVASRGLLEWDVRRVPLGDSGHYLLVLRDPAEDWVEEIRQSAEKTQARLEGISLAAREMSHRLNNQLFVVLGAVEVARVSPHLPANLRGLLTTAVEQLKLAAADIAQLHQVARVETYDTPVGPALDLERSSGAPPARVLVIEDDEHLCKAIRVGLLSEGYDVRTAGNGQEALEVVETYHPDVILLDMHMPVMDGWEFLSNYRAGPEPHAAIVVVSGRPDVVKETAQFDPKAYVVKPFALLDVLDTLEQVLKPSSRSVDR